MILRADFGWIILVAFVFWVLQVLRAGVTGKGTRPGPTPLPPGKPGGTQREGLELEQLLRNLERRLGEAGERAAQKRTTVTVRRPAPAHKEPVVVVRREPLPAPGADRAPEEASLEIDVGDAAGLSLERPSPLAAVVTQAGQQPGRRSAGTPTVMRQLRDAVLWREILGPPKGLQ